MELLSSSIKKSYIVSKESFSYISGNGNPEKISYILSRESFSYTSGNGNPEKKFLIFQETELSYISGINLQGLRIKNFLYFRT